MGLESVSLTNVIAYVSLFISGTLAIFYIKDRRHAKYSIENEYSNQLLIWHASVINTLITLQSYSKAKNIEARDSELVKLSSLIEQGRFYFPNVKPSEYGTDKPLAYRGYRNLALDFLVVSYNLHHKPYSAKIEEQTRDLQRQFTSIVFDVVRPTERLLKIRELTDRYFVKNISIENIEEQVQIEAIRHMWDNPHRLD